MNRTTNTWCSPSTWHLLSDVYPQKLEFLFAQRAPEHTGFRELMAVLAACICHFHMYVYNILLSSNWIGFSPSHLAFICYPISMLYSDYSLQLQHHDCVKADFRFSVTGSVMQHVFGSSSPLLSSIFFHIVILHSRPYNSWSKFYSLGDTDCKKKSCLGHLVRM